MAKIVVCVVCGGQSAEHEVSLQSAKNVLGAINRERFDVLLAGVDKKGVWQYYPDENFLENGDDPENIRLANSGLKAFPVLSEKGPALMEFQSGLQHHFDLLFPVIHGTNGEDGAIQGLCRMLNVPCVGCEQAASANCMDKDLAKRLLDRAGIRVAKWVILHKGEAADYESIIKTLGGFPLFVKPARTGSSVGVTKVVDKDGLANAISEAFKFDTKLLIEECIIGREIECAVLGNETPKAAVPGEIIPKVTFYDYKAKYIMADGAELQAPAILSQEEVAQVQKIAVKAYRCDECAGMSRVDFFFTPNGEWILNEINTIPGFTKISMYPKLWQLSGLSYPQLVEALIDLALEKPPIIF